jgi:hypothetical protein
MVGRNFENDNIDYPYPADTNISDNVVHHEIQQVGPGGWIDIDDEWSWHFVAWVPLEVNGVLRTATLHESPNVVKPSYVQSDGGINIGPRDEWGNEHVAIFVLDEQLRSEHRTAAEE